MVYIMLFNYQDQFLEPRAPVAMYGVDWQHILTI
jgi:hypothetical protein